VFIFLKQKSIVTAIIRLKKKLKQKIYAIWQLFVHWIAIGILINRTEFTNKLILKMKIKKFYVKKFEKI
jgi:hypothetical protein